MAQAPTGIELKAKFFPLAFLYSFLFPPNVEIDGQLQKAKWGTQFVPVTPGHHQIAVSWKYLWFLKVNIANSQVMLAEGEVLKMTYSMRWLMFLPGKLVNTPLAAAVPAAA
jgi:hypothetical protein